LVSVSDLLNFNVPVEDTTEEASTVNVVGKVSVEATAPRSRSTAPEESFDVLCV
jgi:hypothetical protein